LPVRQASWPPSQGLWQVRAFLASRGQQASEPQQPERASEELAPVVLAVRLFPAVVLPAIRQAGLRSFP
jgi:hypothetical protein